MLRRAPKRFGRVGVDSAAQGWRREHNTRPFGPKSSISGFCLFGCYYLNAACYNALDGGVRVEYDQDIFFGSGFYVFLGRVKFSIFYKNYKILKPLAQTHRVLSISAI